VFRQPPSCLLAAVEHINAPLPHLSLAHAVLPPQTAAHPSAVPQKHSNSPVLSPTLLLIATGASLAAAKAKATEVAVAGPIPFLPFSHNQILHACNYCSLPAWFSLIFLPRWRHTKVERCMLTPSRPVLKAPMVSVLETTMC